VPYLRTMLASVTLLLVFAFPAWGQETTSTASPTPTAQETTTATDIQTVGFLGPVAPTEGCNDPTEITTFDGTDNRRTDVFAVPSDVLRIRYLTVVTDPDSIDDNLVVTVFQANGDFVDSVLMLEPASGSQNVLLPGPGDYYLEIEAGAVRYQLGVDACGGDIGPQPGPGPSPTPPDPQPQPQPQPPNPSDPPGPGSEKIIGIPKQEKLVDTGGPPLLLAGAALVCLAGAGIILRLLRR
jgi:hypothetical protein